MSDNKIISFFSGAGGLDTGFHKAGFDVTWANEFDKKITPTLKANFPNTEVDDRSLFDIPLAEIPDNPVGIVGGPPCQSWSLGGLGKGLSDKRGQVFLRYIEVIEDKQPKFFLAENVKGMLAKTRKPDLDVILAAFDSLGYNLTYKLVNANDYGVPQERWRVIFVGYRKDLNKTFDFPEPLKTQPNLRNAIWDLRSTATPALALDNKNLKLAIANHEYSTGGFSSQYMSRNRVRSWEEASFTVQASGRQAPIHPSSPKMIKLHADLHEFADDNHRRLSVREAARIQTFPDDYKFIYNKLELGYKMIGNAVPVNLAYEIAKQIHSDLSL
jgi:DNA (cytosine-5)-methyltransferase 1